jgi:hypothetical protein
MLNEFSFGRSVAVIPADLKQVLEKAIKNGVEPHLDDEQDELYTQICGIAPGIIEAYVSPAARDARLGLDTSIVEFIPAGYDELAIGGLTAHDVAVGHRIGEPGFEDVLGAIAGEIASGFLQSVEQTREIVVGRVSYVIDRTGRVIRWLPLYGEGPSDVVLRATAAWLQREFGPRLNPDKKSETHQARND